MCNLKSKYFEENNFLEAGVDEAGRGCLFGRVYAGIVIWDPNITIPDKITITDSKKLSKKRRDLAFDFIKEHAIDWAVGFCEPSEIDTFNILNSTKIAMRRSLASLNITPDVILIDGNQDFSNSIQNTQECVINKKECKHITITQGDSKFLSIAAASILAKVSHDNYISKLCTSYPLLDLHYGLLSNMGYGTLKHRNGIKEHGLHDLHRRSFKVVLPI